MSAVTLPPSAPSAAPTTSSGASPSNSPWRRFRRAALTTLGWLLLPIGAIGAVLPFHLGVPLLVVALILILRNSFQARRLFVGLQRRHPGVVFPLRRLLRREPEVAPVAWQQLLRMERLLLRHLRWQFLRRLRRRFVRRT